MMSTDFGPVIKRDFQNSKIEYAVTNALVEDSEIRVETLTFAGHLELKVHQQMMAALDEIDNALLSLDDEKRQTVYLKTIYKTMNSLILYSKEMEYVKPYIFISESLQALKAELIDKYQVQDEAVSQKQMNIPLIIQPDKKIQWLGQTNILTTLFFDLMNGVKAHGIPPLIKATPKEIELLIIDNFIDKDGQTFSLESTVKTNLKPSKQMEKRAKNDDAIDLSNYFLKGES
ncbi:hypothetical protein MKQ70_30520 [Chitinophaga sedimenti]|uniref:hypothetical protein n=1 Tax=Chitinophaga sedimenti TaxID=2033606 RepID=UPI002003D1A9|nr:hypothetical protein [Chitinophaga sedimenti]MCK7559079.1 hypothetical protein [Chitinophaga sedimenti]